MDAAVDPLRPQHVYQLIGSDPSVLAAPHPRVDHVALASLPELLDERLEAAGAGKPAEKAAELSAKRAAQAARQLPCRLFGQAPARTRPRLIRQALAA